MLNKGHRNGLSSCRVGCRLGCGLGCRFGTRFGAGLAAVLAGGSSPCGKQFASGKLRVKYNFLLNVGN